MLTHLKKENRKKNIKNISYPLRFWLLKWWFILLISSWSSTQPIGTARGSDLVCTRRGDTTRITVSEPWHIPFGTIIKYGLFVLAALTLPVLIFKLFILPFKLLLGLKAISFFNSLLLGTLLYKFSEGGNYGGTTTVIDSTGSGGGFPLVSGPLPGTLPGTSVSITSSGSSSSSGLKTQNDEDDEDSDYVDVVGPDEEVERILNLVRKKNKNWWEVNPASWVHLQSLPVSFQGWFPIYSIWLCLLFPRS